MKWQSLRISLSTMSLWKMTLERTLLNWKIKSYSWGHFLPNPLRLVKLDPALSPESIETELVAGVWIVENDFSTLNSKCLYPLNTLYILKSGLCEKYLSNEASAFTIPGILSLFGRTTISLSIIVVNAHFSSTSKPVRSANVPFLQMIRKSFSFKPSSAAWSNEQKIR